MIRFLKIVAALTALVVVSVALAAWWYLDADTLPPPALAGHMEPGSLEHDGLLRTWSAYIPASSDEPAPLVFLLHGSMGDGQQMLDITRYRFNELAQQHGFIAVYPDGFERHWNDCRAGASYSANTRDIDDVGFLQALVQEMAARHAVDRSRVYFAGFSNGAQMAYRMGLEAPASVAGIAAIAASLPAQGNFDCTPSGEPVAAIIINGTEDPVNPYAGGVVELWGDASRGEVLSTAETARYWAGLAGYTGEGEARQWPDVAPDDGTTVRNLHWSAGDRPAVTAITVVGGGHSVPHPTLKLPRILGPTSHELDAAEVIWAFFSAAKPLSPGDQPG